MTHGDREREHGIEREPHHHAGDPADDPSERRATDRLWREAAAGDAEEELARHSVFNEPGAIFPPGSPAHRTGTIERDWSCDHCGYNQRGLEAGAPCPECGRTSLSRPAPLEPVSYASWLRRKMDERRSRGSATLVAGLALAGGAWSILSSGILEILSLSSHVIGLVVIAPILEEVLKVAVLAALVERRPYLFRSRGQVVGIAVASAVVFATLENMLHLLVYVASPSSALIVWRVVVCTSLHAACTALAATGLAAAWHRSVTELREPDLAPFTRLLIAAAVIHAGYNAAMLALQLMGLTF